MNKHRWVSTVASILAVLGFTTAQAQTLHPLSSSLTGGATSPTRSSGLPDSDRIKYPIGTAPMFAGFTAYLVELVSVVEGNKGGQKAHYAKELGIPQDELGSLLLLLNDYQDMQAHVSQEKLQPLCTHLLAGMSVTQDEARETLASLDANDDTNDQILREVFERVKRVYGMEVADALQAAVAQVSKNMRYEKLSQVRLVERAYDSDFVEYLRPLCEAL